MTSVDHREMGTAAGEVETAEFLLGCRRSPPELTGRRQIGRYAAPRRSPGCWPRLMVRVETHVRRAVGAPALSRTCWANRGHPRERPSGSPCLGGPMHSAAWRFPPEPSGHRAPRPRRHYPCRVTAHIANTRCLHMVLLLSTGQYAPAHTQRPAAFGGGNLGECITGGSSPSRSAA